MFSGIPDTRTRMAPLVAAAAAVDDSSTAPAPRLLDRPSAITGNHRALANPGHRPRTMSAASTMGRSGSWTSDICSARTPQASSSSKSHRPVRRSSIPGHAAVDMPATVVPSSRHVLAERHPPVGTAESLGAVSLNHIRRGAR